MCAFLVLINTDASQSTAFKVIKSLGSTKTVEKRSNSWTALKFQQAFKLHQTF